MHVTFSNDHLLSVIDDNYLKELEFPYVLDTNWSCLLYNTTHLSGCSQKHTKINSDNNVILWLDNETISCPNQTSNTKSLNDRLMRMLTLYTSITYSSSAID